MSDQAVSYERIRVMVETAERTFRGYMHKPVKDATFRFSDFLNTYDRDFICLTDVQVNERGQQYRAGDRREFVAVAVSAVTFVSPDNGES